MGRMVGANPAQLERLAQRFDERANAIDSARASLSHGVRTTSWEGWDAEQFRGGWYSTSQPSLHVLITDLQDMARELRRQARDQRQASTATGGALGHSGSMAVDRTWAGSAVDTSDGNAYPSLAESLSSHALGAFGRKGLSAIPRRFWPMISKAADGHYRFLNDHWGTIKLGGRLAAAIPAAVAFFSGGADQWNEDGGSEYAGVERFNRAFMGAGTSLAIDITGIGLLPDIVRIAGDAAGQQYGNGAHEALDHVANSLDDMNEEIVDHGVHLATDGFDSAQELLHMASSSLSRIDPPSFPTAGEMKSWLPW